MTTRQLPNVLIAGVQKCGTTWVAKRLAQHPDVYLTKNEIQFFNLENNFKKGVNWYSNFFSQNENKPLICEKCGCYMWLYRNDFAWSTPERIRDMLPEVKLIFIFRDPVARVVSAWNHLINFGDIRPSLEINKIFTPSYSHIVEKNGILSRGYFASQLSHFYEYFDKDRVLVLYFEDDIRDNPEKGLSKLSQFLDLKPFSFSSIHEPENKIQMTEVGVWLSYLSSGLANKALSKFDREVLIKLRLPKYRYQKPSAETLNALYDHYLYENLKLKQMIGYIPDSWVKDKS